jgi:hypothetical protein
VLIRWPCCDDPLWSGNLQLQVRIVGHDHNFAYVGLPRIAWYVPENPTTSKVRVYVRKFRTSPNVRVDQSARGGRLDCGYDPVEWCSLRPQCGPRDAHLVKH